MPIKRVQFPDGTIKRVEVPEGATNEQIIAFVQSQYQPQAAPQQESYEDKQARALELYGRADPAEGMSGPERFMAGVGKSVVDTGRGLRQLGAGLGTLVAPGYARPMMQKRAGELRTQNDESRRLDSALMDTGAGVSGNIAGTVGQVLLPGGALMGAARVPQLARGAGALSGIGRAFLPTTVRGAAAQGVAIGGVQPVGEGDSRLAQSTLGGLLGAGGAAAPKAVGGLYRLLRGQNPAASGITRKVAETIRREAQNPSRLAQSNPSAVPGAQRTLAEETLDPGVAGLERWARARAPGAFDPLDRVNNAARVSAIRNIAGEEGDIAAAELARDEQTAGLLGRALRPVGVDVAPVNAAADAAIAANRGRSSVQRAIREVQAELAEAGTDPAGLYNVRKSINDLIEGKAGTDKSYAKAAVSELIELRGVLDEQISAASPDFGRYLSAYREGSRPIDRMRIGQQLIGQKSGSAILDPVTGEQVLTPASFSRQARDLDRVAQQATGFGKARAGNYLSPEDMGTIGAVRDDLERRAFVATSPAANSQTFERAAMNERVAGGLMGRVPLIGPAVGYLREIGQDRLERKLVEVLANPEQARAILARVPAADRRVIESAISRAGGSLGAMSPALTE